MNQQKNVKRAIILGGICVLLLLAFLIGGHVNSADKSPPQVEKAVDSPPIAAPVIAAPVSPVPAASVPPAALGKATPVAATASPPAEKDGLSVVIQPVNPIINPDMTLSVQITYANISKNPFRFPSGGTAVASILFTLEDVNTGTLYTGGDDMFENGAPRIRRLMRGSHKIRPTDPPLDGPTVSLQPGETRTVTFETYSGMGFYQGKWDDFAAYGAARDSLVSGPPGKPRLDGGYVFQFLPPNIRLTPANIPFPPGTYKLTATIEFPIGDQPGADADPAPLWKGLSIRSNPVEVKIGGIRADVVPLPTAAGAAEKTGWISGTVLDPLDKPAANVALAYYLVTDLQRPETIPAGTTDDKGFYTIKNLPPGRYMVIAGDWTAAGSQSLANSRRPTYGTLQPIEVTAGGETSLKESIRMVEIMSNRGRG